MKIYCIYFASIQGILSKIILSLKIRIKKIQNICHEDDFSACMLIVILFLFLFLK